MRYQIKKWLLRLLAISAIVMIAVSVLRLYELSKGSSTSVTSVCEEAKINDRQWVVGKYSGEAFLTRDTHSHAWLCVQSSQPVTAFAYSGGRGNSSQGSFFIGEIRFKRETFSQIDLTGGSSFSAFEIKGGTGIGVMLIVNVPNDLGEPETLYLQEPS